MREFITARPTLKEIPKEVIQAEKKMTPISNCYMKTYESMQHTSNGIYTDFQHSDSLIGWCDNHLTIV